MRKSILPSTVALAVSLAGLSRSVFGAEIAPASIPAAGQRPVPVIRVFLIGDSTVRNGRGDGAGSLWGWGDFLGAHFDSNEVQVINRALGGRSSRTFLTEGLWGKVQAELHPGDYVLMQFGHNDGGEMAKGDRPRASIKGTGGETREVIVEKTGQAETVHSYGWYLRRYIADARAKGALPIVLSPVPRNLWKEGKVARAASDYGKWARETAEAASAPFIDLNEHVACRYEAAGADRVKAEYFTEKDHTHTTRAGSRLNAEVVLDGLRSLNLPRLSAGMKPTINPRR